MAKTEQTPLLSSGAAALRFHPTPSFDRRWRAWIAACTATVLILISACCLLVVRSKHHGIYSLPAATSRGILQQRSRLRGGSDSMLNVPLRWGIIGPGRIAHDFASALVATGCTVTAVAASSLHDGDITSSTALFRARSFAERFAIPMYYDSYDKLASDANVDIVYVATTNQEHLGPAMMMLRAGKNVLVEKPTTLRYSDAKLMYEEAEKRGLFLMTNHWTRFFPLVKYLRQTFLMRNVSSEARTQQPAMHGSPFTRKREYNLGNVLAMRGCYLVEMALLAAYDHERMKQSFVGEKKGALKTSLKPDGVVATGHGIIHGVSYPVDVESSFSLRWGGGPNGVATCTNNEDGRSSDGSRMYAKSAMQNESMFTDHQFTMITSFQASFRRSSPFEVEYSFERGRIVIHGPANCPSQMTIYEHEHGGAGRPRVKQTKVSFQLPPIRQKLLKYGQPMYPRSEGFAYVIGAIEDCMREKGVPGRLDGAASGGDFDFGCLELDENTIEEQLVTVDVTEEILKKLGYFG